MTQLKNPKVLPKGDKLFLIDAPEMNCDYIHCQRKDGICLHNKCEVRDKYQEALSKAPTWEIKNGEGVKRELWIKYGLTKPYHYFQDWQPEQGKLYDIPTGYTYKFEEVPFIKVSWETDEMFEDRKKNDKPIQFAILIPQKESAPSHSSKIIENLLASITPNEESQSDLWKEAITMYLAGQYPKSKFILTRR